MAKTIVIKLVTASIRTGPFTLINNLGQTMATNVPRNELITGIAYSVDDAVTSVTILSTGKCKAEIIVELEDLTPSELANITFTVERNACLWTHLTNPLIYNYFYGNIEPYIIEYPFAYQFQDEILHNIKDYTRAYKYFVNPEFTYDGANRIEVDNRWFNKAVLYNGQQSTGVLELVPKPMHNLSSYMKYPIFNTNSKTITYTKSDNFYQYNTFWSLVKDKSIPLFVRTCESLSIDKVVNQANMDYGYRSFKKEPLRAKDLKVRHILDDRADAHLVSQFIITPAQISYK